MTLKPHCYANTMTNFLSLNTHSSRTRQYQASSTIQTNCLSVGNAKSNPQNTHHHIHIITIFQFESLNKYCDDLLSCFL